MNLAKSNIVLLIIAVVLAVPTGMQLAGESESFVDYSRIPLMFDGFTEENVGSVQFAKPKAEQPKPNPQTPEQKVPTAYDQLFLKRTDKGWTIAQMPTAPSNMAGAPVNEQRVESEIFDHLKKIRVDKQSMIQANATPEQLEQYGLDEASATLLRVSDKTGANVIASLYIGNDAAGQLKGTEAVRGVFVRKHGTNDVVLYEFDKGWRRDVDPDQWVERVLLKLAPETVTRVAISNAASKGQPIAFSRTENKASWIAETTPEGRGAVRQSEVEGFLARFRWISVQEYKLPIQRAGNLAQLGLLPPDITLELTFKDGDAQRTASFQVGKRVDGEENVHYLTSTEAPFLMTWPAGMVTALEVDVAQSWFDPVGPVVKDPETPSPGVPVKKAPGAGGKKDADKKD